MSTPSDAAVNGRRDRLRRARLYAITPDLPPVEMASRVGSALEGGIDVLQLRHKTLPRGRLLELARHLREAAERAGCLFFVNDHVDIALLSGADGVHLGEDDLPVAAARRLAGSGLLIGASASTPEAAAAAVAEGADLIGCGPAFATPYKPEKRVLGPMGVAEVERAVSVPVFAIGGIDAPGARRLAASGVRRVCIIRAIFDAEDPAAAAREIGRIVQ